MENERETVVTEQTTFSQALATLKQDGSNILFVGADTAGAHDAACDRVLGGSNAGYRLFVTNGARRNASDSTDGASERTQTIDYAAVEPPAPEFESSTGEPPLGALGIEIIETIEALTADQDSLEPADFRLCLDSLVVLLQDHSSESVFRLLHMITSQVDRVQGMGHYHLPVDRTHDAVNLLEPLFDAIVEVRSRGERYEQRWELRDWETSTEWLPLDSTP